MEAVCERGDGACAARALAAALHALHLYCGTISAVLICCCAKPPHNRVRTRWRGQNIRGVASLVLGAAQWCGAAAGALRPARAAPLAAALLAPPAWLVAAVLHVALWTRRSAASLLYLAIYWFLAAVSMAAILWQYFEAGPSPHHVEIYIYAISTIMALIVSGVDCVCFYDEVKKRSPHSAKSSANILGDVTYLHHDSHFYSKISFYWLNSLLCQGYESPLEQEELGDLPEVEQSRKHYDKFKKIHSKQKKTKVENNNSPSIWRCYIRMVWPNFYIAGVFKLFSDLISVVPPLGLAVVIQYIQEDPKQEYDLHAEVTVQEFFSNGYIMLVLVSLALITQGILSQNSTHLVTVEGTRLKTALQGMVFDKCMRLAPWSSPEAAVDEEAPLLRAPHDATNTQSGLLANLVSQDTYNVMSCVWICHYTWAIPLKVAVILYLLYTKLGVSAIIGSAASILFITPLQFFIGKKLSDNSKEIGKCTDHRISKLTEILQGMHVIKLYVWEDLFNEKILNLREVELRFLNKESIYWSSLTFTTQISTILVTVITFTVYYFLDNSSTFTAVNIFTGLALFNQLSVPLLILPVTVLMVIQAMVSTNRIKEYLDLPESNNVREDDSDAFCQRKTDKFNNAFVDFQPEDNSQGNNAIDAINADDPNSDQFSDEDTFTPTDENQEVLVKFRNAAFTWGMKNDTLLEVDHLDIPTGKLIMVVGATGSGKTSFLSCILGEMYIERGDVFWNSNCSTWYAGQPPWLLEGSVRDNIVMDSAWCPTKYARILRATGLRPDLQLLPEGDATHLGSQGAPLSGGQRVRVAVARALYAGARLLALDEPLGALDAALARHVVARALVPAARAGAAVLVATNRLELLHYADLVIAMEDGRVNGFGRPGSEAALARWARLAGEARAAAARGGAGPPGGTARERTRLVRALSRARFHRTMSDDTMVGINEATGAHLLTEVPTCAGGSWRRRTLRHRPALSRQLSSPPPSVHNLKIRRDVRRAVSADESSATLRREASLMRRLLRRPRAPRTLSRWTPRTLRRLLSSDSDTAPDDSLSNGTATETALETSCFSTDSNVGDVTVAVSDKSYGKEQIEQDNDVTECKIWWQYARACGWWGVAYGVAAAAAQGCALAADCWLGYTAAENSHTPLTDEQMWRSVRTYALWSAGGACAAGAAQAACACAGAAARRRLHERMLHAALHAAPAAAVPPGTALQRFGADIAVIDKKLPIAVSRWAQLALLCGAALLVNAAAAPWTLLALLPACLCYLSLQSVYLRNARELQRSEARSAAAVVALAAQTSAGGGTVRAGRLQPRMRAAFLARLDDNHNALLLLNAANRWLGLTLDLVGAASVCVSLGVGLCGGSAAAAGLAGAYSLLLPAFLAHLAKCRADLDLQLAAVERVRAHTALPQEDYREDCPLPAGWERNGKIEMENLTVQPEPGAPPILHNINLAINPGEKVAICGRSGSGKSTLLLSCVGGTSIASGRILIDGVDARHVPLRALRHRIVVLPQEPIMFSGTLRENLDPLAVHTDEEIWHSIDAVGLHEFVTSQPAGLECCVGATRGWSLGRAARACAARALLHARLASALLLDEPGAALDAPAERALLANMAAAAPSTTVITVAHRVSSVRGYDRGVVLDAGRAAEQGPMPQLLALPGSRLAAMLAAPQHI